MKKILFTTIISVVTALGISTQELLILSGKAGVSLKSDKNLSSFLNRKNIKLPAAQINHSDETLPVQRFIHECYKNDIAVFREVNNKEYSAVPRDDLFKRAWKESCDKLREIKILEKQTINTKPLKLKSGVMYLSPANDLSFKKRWYIAKFKGSPSSAQFEIGDYVGQNVWLVKPKQNSRTDKIISAIEFTSDKKIDPLLYSYDSYQVGDSPGLRVIDIYVINSKKSSEVKSKIINFRGEVVNEISSIGCVTALIPVENISKLSENENIKWIGKTGPQLSVYNDGARTAVGANSAQQAPYEYSGTNVDVLVYDGGLTDNHVDYSSRRRVIESGSSHYHATHVAGTILGDGSASSGAYRGMAPEARLISGEYDGNSGILFYNNPADIEADYNTAINTYGADLANNSIGMNIYANGYSDSYYGNYETCSILIDNIATGILGRTFLSVWAAGNERNYPIPDYHNIAPPQCAKNSIVVGATYSDNNQIADFSSFGPLDDGRLKPDLCAPGSENGSGIYSTYRTTEYQNLSGTSMASPVATGCATLLTECWKDYHSGANPAPAVVKAILINTTLDLGAPGPGFDTGYGLIQIIPALETVKKDNIIESEISDGDSTSFSLFVPDTADYVRVTLVWSDPPASPLADPVLVNDLDIKIIDPNGGIHFPWTLNPSNPANSATNNVPDRLNNVEQIYAQNVTGGIWRVEVSGYNVPVGGSQQFALCANVDLRELSSAGIIFFDRSSYTAPSGAFLEVKDLDLTNEAEISVSTFSDSEPSGEIIILAQSFSGIFTGTVSLTTNSPAGSEFLTVAHGDTISAVYFDANNGMGETNITRTATATIDLIPPFIFNVAVVSAKDTTATVEWETDKSAKGSLILVTPFAEYYETDFTISHQLTLTNLTPGTEYQFLIVETDSQGLIKTNDNSGNFFSFNTKIFLSKFGNNAESGYDEWKGTSGWHRSQLRPLSGSWSWYCGKESSQEYRNNHNAYLETPNIAINGPNASMRFKEYIDTESGYDFCYVQITTDGYNWHNLRPKISGSYTERNVSLPLDNYAPGTFRVRFRFDSDSFEVQEGWYVDDVQIGGFTYSNLVVNKVNVADPLLGGDGDDTPEPGETIDLQVILLNDMNQSLSNINSTLLTGSPYVSLIQSNSHYGNIDAYSPATNSLLFKFSIATNTPNHASLPFTLACSDYSGQVWTNDFNIFVEINSVPEGSLLFIILSAMLWAHRIYWIRGIQFNY